MDIVTLMFDSQPTSGSALVAGIAECGDVVDHGKRGFRESGTQYNDPAGPIKEVGGILDF